MIKCQQGHGRGGDGIEIGIFVKHPLLSALADVGSRTGDGKHKDFTVAYRCAGLLLRSAKSPWQRGTTKTPTLLLRKFPEELTVWLLSSAARPGRAAPKSTPEKNSGIFQDPASKLNKVLRSTV